MIVEEIIAILGDTCEVAEKPKNECHKTRGCDIYIGWFESEKATLDYIEKYKQS